MYDAEKMIRRLRDIQLVLETAVAVLEDCELANLAEKIDSVGNVIADAKEFIDFYAAEKDDDAEI